MKTPNFRSILCSRPEKMVKHTVFGSQMGSKHTFSNLYLIPSRNELETFLKKTEFLIKFYIEFELHNSIKVLPVIMVINATHYFTAFLHENSLKMGPEIFGVNHTILRISP